jgi:hypothetical protein
LGAALRQSLVDEPLGPSGTALLFNVSRTITEIETGEHPMPLKLNVGVRRKTDLTACSSLGASCSAELQLPALLTVDDLQAFQHTG